MSIEEIEKLAYRGEKMPEFSSLADVCLYQALANLYARYRSKSIGIEQASAEKGQIIRAYQRTSTDFKRYLDVCRTYQDNVKGSEMKMREVENGKSVTETMCHALEVIECLTGEKSLLNRTLKRLGLM